MKKQGRRTDLTLGQNDTKLRAADILAEEWGVSAATVKRAGKTSSIVQGGKTGYRACPIAERNNSPGRKKAKNG